MGVAAAATLALAAACGGSPNGTPSAPALQRVASVSLAPTGQALSRPLPPDWEITMEVWFGASQSTLRVGLGSAAVMVFDGSHVWHRVEITRRGLVVDGHRTGASPLAASSVAMRALHGAVDIRKLLITRSAR